MVSYDAIPDGVKVTGAIMAPALTFLGITVEDWTFILSAVVSVLFIIEKLPMFINRVRAFIRWMREAKIDLRK